MHRTGAAARHAHAFIVAWATRIGNPQFHKCATATYGAADYPRGRLIRQPGAWGLPEELTGAHELHAREAIDDLANNVNLACRRQGDNNNAGYTANVAPNSGRFSITRRARDGSSVDIVARQVSLAIKKGTASNHIELRCIGSTITLSVNDVQVAQVQDATYPDAGLWWVQPATSAGASMETHFDNFLLRGP